MLILVTGGARSGKSGFAERTAARKAALSGGDAYYIATSVPFDDEMRERMEMHRQRRDRDGVRWQTIEQPYAVADELERLRADALLRPDQGGRPAPILFDCLTLWLTNQLLRVEDLQREEGDAELRGECERLLQALGAYAGSLSQPPGASGERQLPYLVVVTNEVGAGLVPETPLGRRFRDWAGWLNQRAGELADEVYVSICGIPVELKRLSAETI